jgi:hypothetical protein
MKPSDQFLLLLAIVIAGVIAIAFPLAIILNWMKHRRQWKKIIEAVEGPTKRHHVPPRPLPPRYSRDNVSALTRKASK